MKLLDTLKLAWENKGGIAEGFYNTYLSLDKEMKEEAQRRKEICESNNCGHYDAEGNPETSAIPGKPACDICHCNIELMCHTMSKTCSLEKLEGRVPLWAAVTTEDMEKEVAQKRYEAQFKKK